MKRILHISNYYLPNYGGIEQVAYDIVSGLKDEYEQIVVCFNHENGTIKEYYNDILVYRVGYLKKIASQAISLEYYSILKKIILDFKPDIIYIHLPNPLITFYLLLCNLKNKKLIIHWHSDIIGQKYLKLLYKPIQNIILNIANIIYVTSPDYKNESNDLKNYHQKIKILPNVVNENKFILNKKNINNINRIKQIYGEKILFFLGRHIPYKGIVYIIKAAPFINKKAKIIIAGDGPLTPKLKEMAKGLNNIIFLGKITNEEVKEYMHSAYLFLFPSITKNEAFGVAMAEALYCGVPTVGFKIKGSGVNWVNKDGISGYMVENKNVAQFIEKINILIENEELRNNFSHNAKKWVTQNFKKDLVINQLKYDLNNLLGA